MKLEIKIKITEELLRSIRADLHRSHRFAHERVGFIMAGAAHTREGMHLFCRSYHPVDDNDYERSSTAGAQIGSDAMRKALEQAYAHRASLIHVHTHGGHGRPEFSAVDLRSARDFVPGFFNALPSMPHGLMVLSNDNARALIWTSAKSRPTYADGFSSVGAGLKKFGEAS